MMSSLRDIYTYVVVGDSAGERFMLNTILEHNTSTQKYWTVFLKELMLSTAWAGRVPHSGWTHKKNCKNSFSKSEGSVVYNDTHVKLGFAPRLKEKQEDNTDDQKQAYKYKVTQGSSDNL